MSNRFLEGMSEKKVKRIAGGLLIVCMVAAIWLVIEMAKRGVA
jgi:hypothetical protein